MAGQMNDTDNQEQKILRIQKFGWSQICSTITEKKNNSIQDPPRPSGFQKVTDIKLACVTDAEENVQYVFLECPLCEEER